MVLSNSRRYLPFPFYRNFMIQGGDPTGTGSGGESIWGKPFKDEPNSKLLHSGRGVVSMANSGPHTNGSQFFILYKSAPHLNYKHTVFGMVVGGLTTLSTMERVPVDDDDRPMVSIAKPISASMMVI
jgi:peptidyl-prolyl cis-trans isomerase-like 2